MLEQSVILDDAIGPERFFVLYGKDNPDKLKRTARRAARLLAESKADLTSVEQLDLGSTTRCASPPSTSSRRSPNDSAACDPTRQ